MAAVPLSMPVSPGGVLRLIREGHAVTRTDVMDVTGLSRSTVMQRLGGPALRGAAGRDRPRPARPAAAGRPAALTLQRAHGRRARRATSARATAGWRCATSRASRWPSARSRSASATGPSPCSSWVAAALRRAARRGGPRSRATCWPRRSASRARSTSPRGARQPADHAGLGRLSGRRATCASASGRPRCSSATSTRWRSASTGATGRTSPTSCSSRSRPGSAPGIISDGELLRGNHGRAGDIGHIRAIRDSDVMCSCGNRGCVAVLASGGALVRQLAEEGFDVSSTADVVDLVRRGRAVPMNHVREAGRVLGAALAAVVSVVAPTRDRDRRASWRRRPSRCWPASARASTSAPRRSRPASCGSSRAASARGPASSARRRSRSSTCSSRRTSTRCSRRAASPRDAARHPGAPRRRASGEALEARASTASSCATRTRRATWPPCAAAPGRRARSWTAGSGTSTRQPAAARSTACGASSRASRRSAASGVVTPAAWGMFTRRLPPFDEPPRTPDEDREVLVEGLAELGEHAAELGVALLLEPLNRYEDHMVNTSPRRAALIADAGSRGLRSARRHVPHEHRGGRPLRGARHGRAACSAPST